MDLDLGLEDSWIFYIIGAFLGVTSIVYFGLELIFNLSPTVKSIILIASSAIFLVSGDLIESGLLKKTFYSFSGFAYLSFLIYIIVRFNPSNTETFLALAASSTIFTGLGYIKNKGVYDLDSSKSKKIIGTIGLLMIALLLFDVNGSQPEYKVDFKDKVDVNEAEIQVGTLEVQNSFPVSRNIELPNFDGCIAYNQTMTDGIYLHPDSEGLIKGSHTRRYNLTDEVNFN
jgi:hypothetical protein